MGRVGGALQLPPNAEERKQNKTNTSPLDGDGGPYDETYMYNTLKIDSLHPFSSGAYCTHWKRAGEF